MDLRAEHSRKASHSIDAMELGSLIHLRDEQKMKANGSIDVIDSDRVTVVKNLQESKAEPWRVVTELGIVMSAMSY